MLNFISTACMQPLGLENGKIKEDAIVSNYENNRNYARIWRISNTHKWTWYNIPSDDMFVQFDLGTGLRRVTAIGTQGDSYGFVTHYCVSYSENGDDWRDILENGSIKVSRRSCN